MYLTTDCLLFRVTSRPRPIRNLSRVTQLPAAICHTRANSASTDKQTLFATHTLTRIAAPTPSSRRARTRRGRGQGAASRYMLPVGRAGGGGSGQSCSSSY